MCVFSTVVVLETYGVDESQSEPQYPLYLIYALRTAPLDFICQLLLFIALVQGEFIWELLELNIDLTQLELKVASHVKGQLDFLHLHCNLATWSLDYYPFMTYFHLYYILP